MLSLSPVLDEAIAARVFPGAVVYLSRSQEIVYHGAAGTLGYEAPFDSPATTETIYDLASLTKIYTLAAALLAFREAAITLETSVHHFFPSVDHRITLERLMAHASGISFPIQALWQEEATKWLPKISVAPLSSEPGTTVRYSCTNFFLLARIVEEVVGESLNSYLEQKILRPLLLEKTTFEPCGQNIAPTEESAIGVLCGAVHDEAARSWQQQTGTCAGNAGLFATARDVARFASIWTREGNQLLHPEDVSRALTPFLHENSYWRGLGFQIDAGFYMGRNAPSGSAGHLGFTGPSLVTHFETSGVAVILNNRVHPTRSGPDRMPWHRQIMSQFFNASSP